MADVLQRILAAKREEIAAAVHERYPAAHPDDAQRYSIHFCRPDGRAQLIEV